MANDFVTVQIMIFRRGKIKGGRHCVIDSSAAHAAQMIVLGRIGIETGIAARVFKFLDQPHPSQQVKVAVNRAQAHLRQSPSDEFMEFDRRRMGCDRLQLLENDLPLPRFAATTASEPARRWADSQQSHLTGGFLKAALALVIIHIENYYR